MTPIITVGKNTKIIHERDVLLKIIENAPSQKLLNETSVKNLISIPNLCNDEIRTLIDNIIEREATLTLPSFARDLLRYGKQLETLVEVSKMFNRWLAKFKELPMFQKIETILEERLEEEFGEKFRKMGEEEKETFRLSILSLFNVIVTEKQLLKDNKKLSAIDRKLRRKTGFGILLTSNILGCPNCNVVLATEEYKSAKKCIVCGKRIRRNKAKTINVHKVPESIKEVWTRNLWFEAFVAKLFRKLGWKTWVNVRVMGSSGMKHEVDVLAIKKGTVLVSECKTGKVKRQDVFNFWAKATDLKAHMGIFALLKSLPESETRRFIEKNPIIVSLEKVGELKEAQIMDKLAGKLNLIL